ncbi:unnamed protein product [Cochlearia groenlandica]
MLIEDLLPGDQRGPKAGMCRILRDLGYIATRSEEIWPTTDMVSAKSDRTCIQRRPIPRERSMEIDLDYRICESRGVKRKRFSISGIRYCLIGHDSLGQIWKVDSAIDCIKLKELAKSMQSTKYHYKSFTRRKEELSHCELVSDPREQILPSAMASLPLTVNQGNGVRKLKM